MTDAAGARLRHPSSLSKGVGNAWSGGVGPHLRESIDGQAPIGSRGGRRCSAPALPPDSSATGPHEPKREGPMGKIRSLVWAGIAALAIAQAATPATADTVKVGLILPYSGPFASLASIMDDAIKLWVKQKGDTVGSTKIEIIRRDTTGPNPDVAKRL